jgi:hypothetical protein
MDEVLSDAPESREIQLRAHVVSALAYEVAHASGRLAPLVASTLGLLHNIGESVALLMRDRPDAAPLMAIVEPEALGGAALAAWGLPERVHGVVARQREPELCRPEDIGPYAEELAVLWVAESCHAVLFGRGAASPHTRAYMEWLGLRETDCAAFCHDVLRPELARHPERLPAAVQDRLLGPSAWRSRRQVPEPSAAVDPVPPAPVPGPEEG